MRRIKTGQSVHRYVIQNASNDFLEHISDGGAWTSDLSLAKQINLYTDALYIAKIFHGEVKKVAVYTTVEVELMEG